MAVKTAAELKAYFETGDVPTQQEFVDLIDTIFSMSSTPSYKVYTISVTQSGTSAPTIEEQENTLIGTPTPSYNAVGVYDLTLTGGFGATADKLWWSTQNNQGDCEIILTWVNANTVRINTSGYNGSSANDKMNNAKIEIRVYN